MALTFIAALAGGAFLTIGVRGDWGFVLALRGGKLAGMVLVGVAIAISTVLFQTVTHNRLLTPSVMGFDALYVALQTAIVFAFGAHEFAGIDPQLRFLLHVLLMLVVTGALFHGLIVRTQGDLHLLLLSGVVFGLFCRSLTGFMQRVLDPNDFAVLQGLVFARFNTIEVALLPVAGVATLAVLPVVWRLVPALDVLALGREVAIGVGLDHDRVQRWTVALAAILVCVSTALVGPVLFLGILVSNLAYRLLASERHRDTLPAAGLIAVIVLAGGQTLMERLVGLDIPLGVVIDFVGGGVFLLLLIRGQRE